MVSVVIPAYNEEELIGKCLDSLVAQKTTEQFEVVLVNNNSTDNTAKIAATYQGKLNLRIILEKERGRGIARFVGFQQASGEIILSTDADTVVPPDWIEKMVYHLKNSHAVAVAGPFKIDDCDWFTNLVVNFIQPTAMRLHKLFRGFYYMSGFNFAVYKEIYDRSGGFNRGLNSQEDVEIAVKVKKLGKIVYAPDTKVISSGRRFKKGVIRGGLPYISTYITYFFLKKEDPMLSDVR